MLHERDLKMVSLTRFQHELTAAGIKSEAALNIAESLENALSVDTVNKKDLEVLQSNIEKEISKTAFQTLGLTLAGITLINAIFSGMIYYFISLLLKVK